MKIKTKGTQLFNVPNNLEGKVFIETLRRYSNKGCTISTRGRGSRKEYAKSLGYNYVVGTPQAGLPHKYAQWLAVYMKNGNKTNELEHLRSQYYDEVRKLNERISTLEEELKGAMPITPMDTSEKDYITVAIPKGSKIKIIENKD